MNSPLREQASLGNDCAGRNVEKTYSSLCLECEIFRKLGRIFMEVTTKTPRYESEERKPSILTFVPLCLYGEFSYAAALL